jgi:Na+/phosphate symporter
MIVLAAAAVIGIAGLLIYAFSEKPKPMEIGRIMFFSGLFVTLLSLGQQTIIRG